MAPLTPIAHAAVTEFPVLQRLLDNSYGIEWVFQVLPQPTTGTPLLAVWRMWPDSGFSDAVTILDQLNASAFRCEASGGVVWSREGDTGFVVEEMAVLPPPGTRTAPHLVIGTAPSGLWTPGDVLW